MKKTILKIFTTTTTVIALFYIVFLILTSFGKVTVEEFDNSIVRTICLVLGGVFVALSIASHVLLYINEDAIKEIVLRSDKEGTARTSLAVIKKITQNTVKTLPGVKCKKCAVISNEFGIRLKVWLSIKDRDMKETEELVRAYLEDAFWGALEFRFFAIDINLKKINAKHVIDKEAIDKKLAEKEESAEETTEETPATIETEEVKPVETETVAIELNENDAEVKEEAPAEEKPEETIE